MKVVFFSHSEKLGGAEISMLELVSTLQKKGVECLVLIPKNGVIEERLNELEISYKIAPYKWWMSGTKELSIFKTLKIFYKFLYNFFGLFKIFFIIKKWKTDIIYTNTITIFSGAILAKLLGIPHIWHIHELIDTQFIYFDFGKSISFKIMNWTTENFIAVSHIVKEKLKDVLKNKKIDVVYQSVTLHEGEVAQYKENGMVILTVVGSIIREKGQLLAVKSIPKLIELGINPKLLLIGEKISDDYIDEINKFIVDNNLQKNVVFTGWIENVDSVISQSDVLLVCSSHESFGRVAVAGMLLGVPVVGSSGGATSEIIKTSENGILFIDGDSQSLAQEISTILQNSDLRERLISNAKIFANENFTKERYASDIINIFPNISKK